VSYRDDLDAAHARIAALEAENERLKEELAELRGEPAQLRDIPEPPPQVKAAVTISPMPATELSVLQTLAATSTDPVERAEIMRTMARMVGGETATQLRLRADKLDPDG